MIINHNISALNTYRQLTMNTTAGSKSLEKLSSGLRINRAGDDAAGLAISEKMRGQIRGLEQASRNAQDSISLIQTAEGALSETHSILQRMRELAVQASNDTNTTGDREEIQKEINQLTSEINRIGNTTEFNTKKLLNGERENTLIITGTAMTPGASVTDGGVTTALDGTSLLAGNYSLEITKTKTNEAFTAEMSIATDMDYSSVDAASTAGTNFADGKITVTDGGTFLEDGSKITLTYDKENGTLQVQITDGTDTADDLIFVDEDGNFTYDNHGLSFSLKEEGLVDGDEIVANVTTVNLAAGEISTEQKGITAHTTDPGDDVAVFTDGVSVSADALAGTWTVTGDNASLTINFVGDDGTTFADEIAIDDGVYSYDAHGISFELTMNDTTAIEFGFKVEDKFDVKATLKNADTDDTIASADLATDYKGATSDAITGSIAGLSFAQTGELDNATHTFSVQQTTTGEDKSLIFQIGANENQAMSLSMSDMRAAALEITGTGTGFSSDNNVTDGTNSLEVEKALDVTTSSNASNAITVIDSAITKVSAERSKLGASQNRLEHTINNLSTSSENLTASESRIRDVDMAKEMMEFTKNSILQQAAQAMLAQANQMPQGVLQLLR